MAYTGKATHTRAVPVTGVDEREFSFARMLAANQKIYNAQHHPSTPVPAPYRAITRVTNAAMDVMYVIAFIGMGACMSTGIWAPVRQRSTATQRTHSRTHSGGRAQSSAQPCDLAVSGTVFAATHGIASLSVQILSLRLPRPLVSLALCPLCPLSM